MPGPNPRNPFPTVDIIIQIPGPGGGEEVVFISRRNPPHGWALPGGFVDYGESFEAAARREAREETGLEVELLALLGVYSHPGRDRRQHNASAVYIARASGSPQAGDDAGEAVSAPADQPPRPLCFDHELIIGHYLAWKQGRRSAATLVEEAEYA